MVGVEWRRKERSNSRAELESRRCPGDNQHRSASANQSAGRHSSIAKYRETARYVQSLAEIACSR
ncbi:hypothetical protein GE21DRAFT_1287587 [Neurospora crassa]|nr:hypothetical protein GE21DRAFT_1287587 [Neurospora crassa]